MLAELRIRTEMRYPVRMLFYLQIRGDPELVIFRILDPTHSSERIITVFFGGTHSLAGERVGGANSDHRPETLAPCILYSVAPSICIAVFSE